jgi:hypothetical protein
MARYKQINVSPLYNHGQATANQKLNNKNTIVLTISKLQKNDHY